jgi:hypothetical protein
LHCHLNAAQGESERERERVKLRKNDGVIFIGRDLIASGQQQTLTFRAQVIPVVAPSIGMKKHRTSQHWNFSEANYTSYPSVFANSPFIYYILLPSSGSKSKPNSSGVHSFEFWKTPCLFFIFNVLRIKIAINYIRGCVLGKAKMLGLNRRSK